MNTTTRTTVTLMIVLIGLVLTAQTTYALPQTNSTTGLPGNMTDPPIHKLATPVFDYWKNGKQVPTPPAWVAGYSQGFQGINITGGHTIQFFYGYFNGSKQFWWVEGYAYGISGKHGGAPSNDYRSSYGSSDTIRNQFHWGNVTGAKDRIDAQNGQYGSDNWGWHPNELSPMPKNTTDNHMNYYIGFYNGQKADNKQGPDIRYCPDSKDNEYCSGFKAGWNEDYYSDD